MLGGWNRRIVRFIGNQGQGYTTPRVLYWMEILGGANILVT